MLGFDVMKQASEVRKHIGFILGGDRGLYGRLTGKENLRYFAALHHISPSDARERTEHYLEMVGLGDRGDTMVEQYSLGMKQRLHVARGLMTDPSVLFMDEPTLGLDPFGAQQLRQLIPDLVSEGKTVLLTTHYMFEADQLCQTIAMINHGNLVAMGSPNEIKRGFSNTSVIEVTARAARPGLVDELSDLEGVERVDTRDDDGMARFIIQVRAGTDLGDRVLQTFGDENVENSTVRDPTLEEAYLNILK